MAEQRDRRSVWARCERIVGGFSPAERDPRSTLLALAERAPSNEEVDRYGEGALAERLEARVAALLGKEAAVWMPSGTMVQQIALRIHCELRGNRRIAFHPQCHLDVHEERGYAHLHGLLADHLGSRERLPTLDDLEAVREPLAAVLLELPARELGGQLPPWEELTAFCARAREREIALHMDGARLWQCPPFYERSLDEIAGLFDTVYVSFYKDLGAPAGATLAGPKALIDGRGSGRSGTAAGSSPRTRSSARPSGGSTRCCLGCPSSSRGLKSSRRRSATSTGSRSSPTRRRLRCSTSL